MPASNTARNQREAKSGFTLIEALVALTLLVAFAAALEPMMFQSRAILASGSGKIKAELFMRSLLQQPFNRLEPQLGVREGKESGLAWRVEVEPVNNDMFASEGNAAAIRTNDERNWILFHVTAEVFWDAGKMIRADTLRLGAAE